MAFEMSNTRAALALVVEDAGDVARIDQVRAQHDRAHGRWMPHVNFIFPFVAEEHFERAAGVLQEALQEVAPFGLVLGEFGCFSQRQGVTVHMRPHQEGGKKGKEAKHCKSAKGQVSKRHGGGSGDSDGAGVGESEDGWETVGSKGRARDGDAHADADHHSGNGTGLASAGAAGSSVGGAGADARAAAGGSGAKELQHLNACVEAALPAAGGPRHKAFNPHMTLGQWKSLQEALPVLNVAIGGHGEDAGEGAVVVRVRELCILTRTADGPFTVWGRIKLGGGEQQ